MLSRVRVSRLIALCALGLPLSAPRAEPPDPTCDRLRAEASAEAALLYAPRVQVEGARAPSLASADDPVTLSGQLQARVSLAVSPVDMLRGRAVERVAAAECVRSALADRLDRVLALGERHGELAATRAELAVLEAGAPTLDAIVADVVARFEHQRATALEVDELRERRSAVRVRAADLRHSLVMLEALDGDAPIPTQLDELARAYRGAALAVDRRRADERDLSAWRVDVRAGLAGASGVDWFAIAEVSYSLGDPWQRAATTRAAHARAEELATSERELPVRVARLERAMRESVAALATELSRVDEALAALHVERDRIAAIATDNESAQQLLARYAIEQLQLDARRAAIAALAEARRAFAGGQS